MTAQEAEALERLRDELHAYHIEVREHIARCESRRGVVVQLAADMYGPPGRKDASPGVLGNVALLLRSRRLVLLALRGAWALLVGLLGAIAMAVLRSN